jgi:hypothetical protein
MGDLFRSALVDAKIVRGIVFALMRRFPIHACIHFNVNFQSLFILESKHKNGTTWRVDLMSASSRTLTYL